MKDQPKVVCPICGEEYLPSEIYNPKAFFGNPGDIIKTSAGKIDFFMGDGMDLEETYICDGCGTPLTIYASMSFEVIPNVEENFDEDYETPIDKPEKIKLEECSIFD